MVGWLAWLGGLSLAIALLIDLLPSSEIIERENWKGEDEL